MSKTKLKPLKVTDDRPKLVPNIGGIKCECPRCGPTHLHGVGMACVILACGCRWDSHGSLEPSESRWKLREY